MKEYGINKDVETTECESLKCNVCNFERTCNNCYYFDRNYHGGYCDKHKVDTDPGKYCGSWVEE